MDQIPFRLRWGFKRSPDLLAEFKGPISKERDRKKGKEGVGQGSQ